MSVKITPTEVNSYLVNGKEVYQDSSSNWICKEELNPSELSAWKDYINQLNGKSNSNPLELHPQQIKELSDLDKKIDKVHTQLGYLSRNRTISHTEKDGLKKYYNDKINKYNEMRNEIINAFPVTYKIVEAHASAQSV